MSASRRCAIRCASPRGVFARWRSSRICSFRFEKTLSIVSRCPACRRSRSALSMVRSREGCKQPHLRALHLLVVGAAPEAFVGDHDFRRLLTRSSSGSYSCSFAGTRV